MTSPESLLSDIFRQMASLLFSQINPRPDDAPADVLKARLKTTGVVEHTFTVKTTDFRGLNWKVCLLTGQM
jgi:hypothetical protein